MSLYTLAHSTSSPARTTYTDASLPLLSGRSTASITPSSTSGCRPLGVFIAGLPKKEDRHYRRFGVLALLLACNPVHRPSFEPINCQPFELIMWMSWSNRNSVICHQLASGASTRLRRAGHFLLFRREKDKQREGDPGTALSVIPTTAPALHYLRHLCRRLPCDCARVLRGSLNVL